MSHLLKSNSGDDLAYDLIAPKQSDGAGTWVIFLTGYRSDRQGGKALHLEAQARERGFGIIRFDFFAHGDSPGDFLEGTISRWTQNAVDVIDQLTGSDKVILAGSSMGGWVMLRAALARREKVAGLLGIAAAPDFTHDLMLPKFTDEERAQLASQGFIAQPTPYDDQPYLISKALLDDGRNCLLLGGPIDINCPVSLVHGDRDEDVPLSTVERLTRLLQSQDVYLTRIKDGEHRLSRNRDLDCIADALRSVFMRAGREW